MPKIVPLRADRPKTGRDRPRPPPKDLGLPEKELWRQLAAVNALNEAATIVLGQALAALKSARLIRSAIEREGLVIVNDRGVAQAHPLLYRERKAMEAFAFGIKALKLRMPT